MKFATTARTATSRILQAERQLKDAKGVRGTILPIFSSSFLLLLLCAAGVTAQTDKTSLYAPNVGKIRFSAAQFGPEASNAAALTSEFADGDAIYGRAFFQTPIVETVIDGENPSNFVYLGLYVTVDGTPIVSERKARFAVPNQGAMYTMEAAGERMYEWITWPVTLLPKSDDPGASHPDVSATAQLFSDALATLAPGLHTVHVELRYVWQGKESKALAVGEFTYNKTTSGAVADFGRGLPAAKMKNPKLESEMKKGLKDAGWTYEVKKIVIVESDWEVHRDAFGNILSRSIDTYVGFTMPDGSCKIFNISFQQRWSGGNYGKTEQRGVGDSYEASCAKM